MNADTEARRIIETCLAVYYDTHLPAVAAGVPSDMRASEPDGEGWCDWKMIPSSAKDADVSALEARLPCRLPPVLRAYLTTFCVLGMDFGEFHLPEVPSDKPLAHITSLLMSRELWAAGYVQVASTVNGDPVCLDVRSPTSDGDFTIVRFNHDFVPRDAWQSRDELEPYAGFVATSFRQFFEDLCMGRRIEAQKSPLERSHEDAWAKVDQALRARGMSGSALPAKVRAAGPVAALAFVEETFPKG
jgi:hypothetical protein